MAKPKPRKVKRITRLKSYEVAFKTLYGITDESFHEIAELVDFEHDCSNHNWDELITALKVKLNQNTCSVNGIIKNGRIL